MKLEILNEKIYYYTDIFTDLDFIFNNIKNDSLSKENSPIEPWKPWLASNSNQVYGRRRFAKFINRDIKNEEDEKNLKLRDYIHKNLINCIEDYCKKTKQDIGINYDIDIFMYNEGIDMGPHVDNPHKPESIEFLKPTVSSVFYINDDYEGGEIEFELQNVFIKPKAGSLIVFPSNEPYYHQSHKVISGNKYMIPSFFFRPNN